MSPSEAPVTRYDIAVETWNDLKPAQRKERQDECRTNGQHTWHRLPGTGGVSVCLRCLAHHDPETAEGRRAA